MWEGELQKIAQNSGEWAMKSMSEDVYYKVVSQEDGKYYSAMLRYSGNFEVRYKRNRWTKPKLENSKLFIFNSLEKATLFALFNCRDGVIFRCKVKGARRWHSIMRLSHKHYFVSYWNINNRIVDTSAHSIHDYIDDAPDHTFAANEVKIFGDPIDPFTN